jgi:1-acyl-sn-glycerol-3-phosphate acyltransferase
MSRVVLVMRTITTVVVGVLVTIVSAISAMVLARRDPNHPAIERVIDRWSRAWLRAAGVELDVRGLENVERSRSYVVVANHLSLLDIMACFLAVPVPIRFLAKKELFRIPILAPAMRAVGIVEVDRQARVPIHDQINAQAKQLVANGRSVIIYPEGTRSRDGRLGAFKKGAFTIAARVGLPILPVTIHGTWEAWRPGSWLVRGGPVTVVIDQPVETENVTRTDELRDEVRGIIERRLAELSQS